MTLPDFETADSAAFTNDRFNGKSRSSAVWLKNTRRGAGRSSSMMHSMPLTPLNMTGRRRPAHARTADSARHRRWPSGRGHRRRQDWKPTGPAWVCESGRRIKVVPSVPAADSIGRHPWRRMATERREVVMKELSVADVRMISRVTRSGASQARQLALSSSSWANSGR